MGGLHRLPSGVAIPTRWTQEIASAQRETAGLRRSIAGLPTGLTQSFFGIAYDARLPFKELSKGMRIPSTAEFFHPSLYRRAFRKISNVVHDAIGQGSSNYENRLRSEQNIYKDCADVHSLPRISHYWSNKYIRPNWNELPHSYRFNQQLRRFEETFLDWNCSTEGFEGIRAQDILPLLVERFEFDLFAPFANVIEPFIDRSFGHNFDPGRAWDLAFIDRVHARDEQELQRGTIKPTHMFAVMCLGRKGESVFLDGLTPAASIRIP